MKKDLNLILKCTKETKTGCLEWTRCFNTDGYPRAVFDGNSNGKVHRVVWELYNKTEATGYVIRHTCDNPKCINPNHLLLGTVLDNVNDMLSRNRHWSKLVPEEVKSIRSLYQTGLYTQKALGQIFKVSTNTVSSLINYTHWKSIN